MLLTVLAQSERGTLSGTVLDKSGAIIPNAKVVVTNAATNVANSVTTNETGAFVVPNLPPGTYTLRADRDGFRPTLTSGITVDAGSTVREDVTLEIGSSTQVLEVTADAAQLSTDNAKSQTVLTDKLIRDLPTVVSGGIRSPFDLAIIAPESKNFGDNNFALGGGQAASYGVNLDGVSANTTRALSTSWVATNTPSLDAITEFTVETNGFKAEFGHAGGGSINFVSKSGTNQFHGSAYEFVRNNFFDARRFFAKSVDIYKQNDFGATVGGPVWIPKLYRGKDKTFFFFSWESFRNRNGADNTFRNIPTPEMYTGDFSKWVNASGQVIPIYDPFSLRTDPATGAQVRTPFPGNIIPTSRFDPLSVKALAAYTSNGGALAPNVGTAIPGTFGYVQNNYQLVSGTVVQPQDKYSVKIDHSFNERNRLSGYIGWNRTSEAPGPSGPKTLPGNYTNYNDTQRNSEVYRLSYDHTFAPTLLNRFFAGGNNWRENHDPPQAKIGGWKDKVCLPNVPDCDQNLVNIDFATNYQSWGGRANNGSENTVFSFNDDLTWIKSNHTIKFGAMHQRSHYNGLGRQCVSGCANFSFIGTNQANDNNQSNGGNAFASFLLGWATDGGVDTIRFIAQQWPYFAGYAQDDWRITPKLTLNLGLRWETTLPPVEAEDKWSDFSPTTPNPGADNRPGALIYAGTGTGRQGTRSLADSWFKGFGPRIGAAYSWDNKTVIRANFARSFAAVTTTTGSTHQKGFTQTTSFPNSSNGTSPSFLFKDGLPAYGIPPFISPTFQNGSDMPWWQNGEVTRAPENLSWNLSVQRQLGSTLVLEVAYNALVGTHLQSGMLNYNQVDPKYLTQYGVALLNSRIDSPAAVAAGFKLPYTDFIKNFGNRATVLQSLRPFPQYTDINTWDGNGDHSGHSSYHAGILKLDKRFGAGLTMNTSYVFSKILTDSDTYWITDNPRAADQYNRRLEKSIGSYDVTHNFKLGISYELPFGKGKQFLSKGVAAYALGGWRISTIQLYTSGRPIGLATGNGYALGSGERFAPYVTTYEGWRGPITGSSFDPQTDRFFQPASFFGTQYNDNRTVPLSGTNFVGNATRFNPKLREFPNLTENISIAKYFKVGERFQAELRGEAFNVLNRVRFAYGGNNLTDPSNLGRVTSQFNTPRQLQLGLKILF